MSGLTQLLPHWNTPVRARVRPEPSHRVVRTEALPHDVKARWGWIRVRSGSFHGPWSEFNSRWPLLSGFVLPHPGLVGLSLLMAFVAIVWYQEQELLEEAECAIHSP